MIGPLLLIGLFICFASIFIPSLRQLAKGIMLTAAVLALGLFALIEFVAK